MIVRVTQKTTVHNGYISWVRSDLMLLYWLDCVGISEIIFQTTEPDIWTKRFGFLWTHRCFKTAVILNCVRQIRVQVERKFLGGLQTEKRNIRNFWVWNDRGSSREVYKFGAKRRRALYQDKAEAYFKITHLTHSSESQAQSTRGGLIVVFGSTIHDLVFSLLMQCTYAINRNFYSFLR